MRRDIHVDFYKGLAIINTIIYHFVFNLNYFNFIDLNFKSGIMSIYRGFIIVIFIVASGITTVFVNQRYKFQKFYFQKLFLAALIITITSYFLFNKHYIYFGIIHFILFAKICGLWLWNKPKLALLIGIIIIIIFGWCGSINLFSYFGFSNYLPLDLINIIPWAGVFCSGIFLGHYRLYKILPVINSKIINKCGKKSLFIYLTHQLVLFPLVYLLTLVT